MSQSPYNPPPYAPNFGYFSPQGNLLAAGRRAGTLMLVVGGLILLMGLLNTIQSAVTSGEQMLQNQQKLMPSGNDFHFSATAYKASAVAGGLTTIITGLVVIGLALGVRRGGKGSTIAAIVVTSLLLLMTGLATLVFMIGGLAAPIAFLFSCLTGVATVLLIWQLIWLIGAARNTTALWAAQQQYQMQYWQYQQNAQAYSGYGYGSPPASPLPPASPPTPPNDSANAPNHPT